jgi:hypothetical protein
MDLDNFLADYRKFKARVLPMLEAWEKEQPKPELDPAIYAPLSGDDPKQIEDLPPPSEPPTPSA